MQVATTNGRPSDQLRKAESNAKRGSGCCGGAARNGIVRPIAPWPAYRPEGAEALVNWIAKKMMNAAQRFRNSYVKVKSYRHACRLGRIDYESYHLRRLHCDGCEHQPDDPTTQGCMAEQCHCRNRKGVLPKRAVLESKLKLAGWQCPAGYFGVRHQVSALRDIERSN